MSELTLDLVDNGLDYVIKSLESLDTNDTYDLKYTSLHLYSGILLLLKERLSFVDWTLLFQNLNKANEQSLEQGNFASVNFPTLLDRLEEYNVDINDAFKFDLKWLSNERNKMEHFKVNINSDVLKTRIVSLLTNFIPFIREELINNDLLSEDDQRFIAITDFLHNFENYIDKRLNLLEKSGYSLCYTRYIQCPNCSQETVEIIGDSEAKCYFCNSAFGDFPKQYVQHFYNLYGIIKNGGDDPRLECVSCSYQTMIFLEDNKKYVCLSCGESYDSRNIGVCEVCGINPVTDYSDGTEPVFCDYCIEDFMHRD